MALVKRTKVWRALTGLLAEAQRINRAKETGILKMGGGRITRIGKRGTK